MLRQVGDGGYVWLQAVEPSPRVTLRRANKCLNPRSGNLEMTTIPGGPRQGNKSS